MPNEVLNPVSTTATRQNMFPFAPIAGLLGAGLNFFTERDNSQRASEMSKYNTDATIKAQKDAADLAYRRNLEQWNRENSFNNPATQMQRLKSAGMNPMLAAGSGTIGANSAANGASAPVINPSYNYQASMTPRIDHLGLMTTVQNLAMGKAQINKVNEETGILKQEKTIRAFDALLASLKEENAPDIVKAFMRKLLADTEISETSAKLQTGSLQHDLAYRKAISARESTSASRQADEFKKQFPEDVKIKLLQREILEQQKGEGQINLKMLQDIGIDKNAPTWLKLFGRNKDKLPKWLSDYFN